MTELIIDTPSLQSLRTRLGYTTLTAIGWMLWMNLWLPLLSLVAWVLELHFIYKHMIKLEGYTGLSNVIGVYLVVIFALGCLLLGWARLNYARFRGTDRRAAAPPVTSAEVARYFNLSEQQLAELRGRKSQVVFHDEQGNLLSGKPHKIGRLEMERNQYAGDGRASDSDGPAGEDPLVTPAGA